MVAFLFLRLIFLCHQIYFDSFLTLYYASCSFLIFKTYPLLLYILYLIAVYLYRTDPVICFLRWTFTYGSLFPEVMFFEYSICENYLRSECRKYSSRKVLCFLLPAWDQFKLNFHLTNLKIVNLKPG